MRSVTAPDRVQLPDGTRLVHIGPHKTGTTTLQGAFHRARRAAAMQGVHYAGPNRQPLHAARAIADMGKTKGEDLRHWRRLVREIEGSKAPRVLVSSEWFGDASDSGIRRLAGDLGADRVHIAVTLRPLRRIVSSQWQQSVQAGMTRSFESWLESLFQRPDGLDGLPFWHRHRHDRLVERWAAVFGTDRVVAVVADDRDRDVLLRSFEGLTGLRAGTLVAADDRQNRSLTAAEVELVQQITNSLMGAGVDAENRLHIVLHGAADHLKQRLVVRQEPRIQIPAWAVSECERVGREIVDNLRASGIRVLGDLETLVAGPAEADTKAARSSTDWPTLATVASMGALAYVGLARGAGLDRDDDRWPDSAPAGAPVGGQAPRILGREAAETLSTTRLRGVFSARVAAFRARGASGTNGDRLTADPDRVSIPAPIHSGAVEEQ
jgi:hypothetical protein